MKKKILLIQPRNILSRNNYPPLGLICIGSALEKAGYKVKILPTSRFAKYKEIIEEECLNVAEYLGMNGPSCMQMKEDENDIPILTEINPRMGGGTIITTYAGVNFPELTIKIVEGNKIKIPKIKKVTMLRYYEEVILDEEGRVIKL